jgi:hypothetical protein
MMPKITSLLVVSAIDRSFLAENKNKNKNKIDSRVGEGLISNSYDTH